MRTKVFREHTEGLYQKLSKIICQTQEAFYLNDFKLRNRELCYKGKGMPFTTQEGKLRLFLTIAKILSEEGLRELGFNIHKSSKLMAQQAIMLNRVKEELPSGLM